MTDHILTRMESYFDRLWPLCRSITGPGYRDSLDILAEVMPCERLKFKTGETVFDWEVPREWIPHDAYFTGPDGRRYGDFKKNNLHLLGYSIPFRGRVPLDTLLQHLYSLPDHPNAIPYLTSYYKERWGFCIKHEELAKLPMGDYNVVVDTELVNGHVEVGEAVLPGESDEEILFTSYLCHPSLANNELSGPLVLAFLYEKLAALPKRRYTYRFVIGPETIGSLCYLKMRGDHLKKKLKAGFLLTCVGRRDTLCFKRSRRGDSDADRAARAVLIKKGEPCERAFDPADGSDDRQYCSPGFNLPYVTVIRGMEETYSEYHSSLDNKSIISFETLCDSRDACFNMAMALEKNHVYQNTGGFGEPQLGKRGLYNTLGSQKTIEDKVRAMMWLLNFSDGTRDLIDISLQSGQPLGDLQEIATELLAVDLLRIAPPVAVKNP